MRRRTATLTLGLALCAGLSTTAQAADIDLFDFGINIDGTTDCSRAAGCDTNGLTGLSGVAGVNDSGFDYISGLGTISVTIMGAGTHNVDLFVDHEIDEAINTFFNEYGAAVNSPTGGQSWEIDEPDFVFGDIFSNFLASTLDNTNGVPMGMENDVAMALGSDFVLAAGETATIDFMLDLIAPGSGFYLAHTDPASNATIYFSSILNIERDMQVPEPATLALMGLGLAGIGYRRQRSKKAV